MLRIILFFMLCANVNAPEIKLSQTLCTIVPPLESDHPIDLFDDQTAVGYFQVNDSLKRLIRERGARLWDFAACNTKMTKLVLKMQNGAKCVCKDIILTPEKLALIQCWRSNIHKLEEGFLKLSPEEKDLMFSHPRKNPITAWFNMLDHKKYEAPKPNPFTQELSNIAKAKFRKAVLNPYIPWYFRCCHTPQKEGQAFCSLELYYEKEVYPGNMYVKVERDVPIEESIRKAIELTFNPKFECTVLEILDCNGNKPAELRSGEFYLIKVKKERISSEVTRFAIYNENNERLTFEMPSDIFRDMSKRDIFHNIHAALCEKFPGQLFWVWNQIHPDQRSFLLLDYLSEDLCATIFNNGLTPLYYGIVPQNGPLVCKNPFPISNTESPVSFSIKLKDEGLTRQNISPECVACLEPIIDIIFISINGRKIEFDDDTMPFVRENKFSGKLLHALLSFERHHEYFVGLRDEELDEFGEFLQFMHLDEDSKIAFAQSVFGQAAMRSLQEDGILEPDMEIYLAPRAAG